MRESRQNKGWVLLPRRFGAQADTMQWPTKPKVSVLREKEEGDGNLVLQQGMANGMERPGYGKICLNLELRGSGLWADEPHGIASWVESVSQCRERERREHKHRAWNFTAHFLMIFYTKTKKC